jgi:hypothetical protein
MGKGIKTIQGRLAMIRMNFRLNGRQRVDPKLAEIQMDDLIEEPPSDDDRGVVLL